jgi:hypothetical protein
MNGRTTAITPSLLSLLIPTPFPHSQLKPFATLDKMHSYTFIAFLAALPATFACLAYDKGLPSHTGTKSLSAPQYIKKGETFDAKWVKVSRF